MSTPTKHQIIEYNGKPLLAIIPYEEYREAFLESPEDVVIPLEVSKIANLGGKSLIRAWREHLGLTQSQVAQRMGLTRAAYAQMESAKVEPRMATLKKIAAALNVSWEQLRD